MEPKKGPRDEGAEVPGLEIQKQEAGRVTVLVLRGTLDLTTLPAAKATLEEAWPDREPKILFDLGEVRFIDSAGLGLLIGSLRRAAEAGGDLKLCGLNAYLMALFKLVNLQRILKTYESREAALAAFADVHSEPSAG